MLRSAQGRLEAAVAAMRRAVAAAADPLKRVRLLPAHIEILLAAGNIDEAHAACRELEEIAESYGTDVLRAMAARACGTLHLADGRTQEALGSLQRARQALQELDMPYLAACVRVEIACACRTVADEEGAELECDAARAVFARLGAAPDVARIAALMDGKGEDHSHGLTARELQVLRMLASGKTNKTIATSLTLSEKTVDRHVSNILAKLAVSSRTGATAYAYQHKLI